MDLTPTRSLAIALADERRTMREGAAFLDEKCLLLAGEMLRELQAFEAQRARLRVLQRAAEAALADALCVHGLAGLEVHPAATASAQLQVAPRTLLGVSLAGATGLRLEPASAAIDPAHPSPEARACAAAWSSLLAPLAQLAAQTASLARLHAEYRRTVRRVRALQDVLLPEVDSALAVIETGLDELEQDEAAMLRRAVQAA